MGLLPELQIDGDRCRACRHLLAKWGRNLGPGLRYRDGMRILVYHISCRFCNAVTEIEYIGELLPTRHMRELMQGLAGKRRRANLRNVE